MSVIDERDQIFGFKFTSLAFFMAFLLGVSPSGQAEPVVPPAFDDHEVGKLSMEELSTHTETIADILETAGEQVEQIAASHPEAPALVDAIRHELALSRRWNKHLGTILLEVVKARRTLAKREREAAREIARMTAVAEEARLELIELRNVLKKRPAKAIQNQEKEADSRLHEDQRTDITGNQALNPSVLEAEAMADELVGLEGDLDDARATLASMEALQAAAVRDVDAVRGRIIEALKTIAKAQGNIKFAAPIDSRNLSSEDITAWAASVATKLNHASEGKAVID